MEWLQFEGKRVKNDYLSRKMVKDFDDSVREDKRLEKELFEAEKRTNPYIDEFEWYGERLKQKEIEKQGGKSLRNYFIIIIFLVIIYVVYPFYADTIASLSDLMNISIEKTKEILISLFLLLCVIIIFSYIFYRVKCDNELLRKSGFNSKREFQNYETIILYTFNDKELENLGKQVLTMWFSIYDKKDDAMPSKLELNNIFCEVAKSLKYSDRIEHAMKNKCNNKLLSKIKRENVSNSVKKGITSIILFPIKLFLSIALAYGVFNLLLHFGISIDITYFLSGFTFLLATGFFWPGKDEPLIKIEL